MVLQGLVVGGDLPGQVEDVVGNACRFVPVGSQVACVVELVDTGAGFDPVVADADVCDGVEPSLVISIGEVVPGISAMLPLY